MPTLSLVEMDVMLAEIHLCWIGEKVMLVHVPASWRGLSVVSHYTDERYLECLNWKYYPA